MVPTARLLTFVKSCDVMGTLVARDEQPYQPRRKST